jgi:hypothetical protein
MKAIAAGAGQGAFYAEDCPKAPRTGLHCACWEIGHSNCCKCGAAPGVQRTYPPGCCPFCGSPAMKQAVLAWMDRLVEDDRTQLRCPDCSHLYGATETGPEA